jgi:hypothetical protein
MNGLPTVPVEALMDQEQLLAEHKQLCQIMYELTRKKCENCGDCCFPEACEQTRIELDRRKVIYPIGEDSTFLFRGNSGCVLEPWMRPTCVIHICDSFLKDLEFRKQYLKLRKKIDTLHSIMDEKGMF